MKMLSLVCLMLFAGHLGADTTLDTMVGVSITAYETSPAKPRSREALLEGKEAKDSEPPSLLSGYHLKWMVSVPERRIRNSDNDDAKLILKFWDPIAKQYPGWNPPIVEIFSGDKRVGCQELAKVGWALDLWADTQNGLCLSILTSERHRLAKSTNVYRLNPDSMTFEHQCSYFSKEELKRESDQWRAMHSNPTQQQGEQGVAPQSATRSELESEGGDTPQPESEERSR